MPDFDETSRPPDATVIRPRPGAGRRGVGDAARVPRAAAPPPGFGDAMSTVAASVSGAGLNPLAQVARPLLLLAGQLRISLASPDTIALKRLAREEIRRFEERAQAAGVAGSVVRAASYALCATVDEAVLSTPWGAESGWAQTTLLMECHREAWGGEKFFDILDGVSRDPVRHLELLELQYLCMAVGFAGKYHVAADGVSQLREIQHRTYRLIRDHRGAPESPLSLRWRGVDDRRNPVIRYVPWWVVGIAALVIVAITYTVLAARLRDAALPVQQTLIGLGDVEAPASPPRPPAVGPTLRQLLAQEDARGSVLIEERGNQTIVTPAGDELFSSGSATVNARFEPLLAAIAAALNQLPGRVVVTGHTDDQPLRSSIYADNFELSRERAVSVGHILQRTLQSPGRVTWTGAGSLRPRFTPASLPQNRARNRRVEILHVPDR